MNSGAATLSEEDFPLAVRTARSGGRSRRFVWLVAVGIADQRDEPVAAGNVLFEFFEQRTAVLLEILLYDNLGADRAQVAAQLLAAVLEL